MTRAGDMPPQRSAVIVAADARLGGLPPLPAPATGDDTMSRPPAEELDAPGDAVDLSAVSGREGRSASCPDVPPVPW
jgi:hypothetical protein